MCATFCRCSLSSDEIERMYHEGTQAEVDETTRIMFIPISSIAGLQMDHPEIWNQYGILQYGSLNVFLEYSESPLAT